MAFNIKDIAEELNISTTTVSRALSGNGRVSEETRKKVKEAAKKYNYVPNKVAQSLRKSKTNTIGMIVPDIGDYFAGVINGAEDTFSMSGYSLLLANSLENAAKEAKYAELLKNSMVDGLIIATVSNHYDWIEKFEQDNTPIIFFDNEPVGVDHHTKVLLDNRKAIKLAVDHLVNAGHKRIALICGNTQESTALLRKQGYIEEINERGIELDYALIKESQYYVDAGYTLMMELLNNKPLHDFSAVIVTTKNMTFAAIRAIKEYGLSYPEDLSIVGFDIEDKDRMIEPSITSVVQPSYQIGVKIAEELIGLIKEADVTKVEDENKSEHAARNLLIDPLIKIGASTKWVYR